MYNFHLEFNDPIRTPSLKKLFLPEIAFVLKLHI